MSSLRGIHVFQQSTAWNANLPTNTNMFDGAAMDKIICGVFADAKSIKVEPTEEGVAGFQAYLKRYKAALAAQQAAAQMV